MSKAIAVTYFAGCLFASLSHVGYGQEALIKYSGAYNDCLEKALGTSAMLGCVAAEQNRQEAKLEKAYMGLMQSKYSSSETTARLKVAHDLWPEFREKWCGAYGELAMGADHTGAKQAEASCALQMTAERAEDLTGLLRSLDPADPVPSDRSESGR